MDRKGRRAPRRAPLCLIFLVVWTGSVIAEPIAIDFNKCSPSLYQTSPSPDAPLVTFQCCPPKLGPNQQIVDGLPTTTVPYTRVRRAIQCTGQSYAKKLDKAYRLMRALPDSDPRSLNAQMNLHCAYCGGAFYNTDANGVDSAGIDIHFGWLFFPWHRLFLYFHERILQSLLKDPKFSLNFWNWDNPYDVRGSLRGISCMKSGHNFPTAYGSKYPSAFDGNRSQSALGLGRLPFPDLSFNIGGQPLANASADVVIQSNLNIINQALVSGGTTTETFLGRPYRAGDLRSNPTGTGGGGSLELSAHAGVHFWTGQLPPLGIDMGSLPIAGRDPIFYSHHANVDRMFQRWKDLGPYLGQNRSYYSDPDFLNATFLFYDETQTLRRVRAGDSLDLQNLGYRYETVNDAAWILFNSKRCVRLGYTDIINQARSVPAPVRQSNGFYRLLPRVPLVFILDRPPPAANSTDQFLVISNITLNRLLDSGFDVYLNMPMPYLYPNRTACPEYSGSFINMRRSQDSQTPRLLTWSQSITQTLASVGAPAAPSSVVVTIVPITGAGTITFFSVAISNTSS